MCVPQLLQCVFRVSYLHSHALCSVKLMNTSFCCFRRFSLFICLIKGKNSLGGGVESKQETAKQSNFIRFHKLPDISSHLLFDLINVSSYGQL